MTSMLDRVTEAWTRAWGEGDTAAFERLVAPDYERQSKTGSEGLAEVVEQIEASHRAFSDFHVTVLRAIEDANLVAIHWETTGTHTGEFMGVPPTGPDGHRPRSLIHHPPRWPDHLGSRGVGSPRNAVLHEHLAPR
jgi:hypothetical protein